VSAVRSKWARIGLAGLLLVMVVGSMAMASSLFGTTYDVGEEIRFQVEDSTTWWWGCCSCQDSLVLGWRIVNLSGQVVYSVIHDAPVAASIWQGSWLQLDMNGVAVAAGQYRLLVDTSVGTLSRCFKIQDPCNSCNWCTSSCTSCICEDVPSITTCSCTTTLVFVDDCNSGFFPFFLWGCNSCSSSSSSSSSSSGCSSCP
jgi:hypothetical protein